MRVVSGYHPDSVLRSLEREILASGRSDDPAKRQYGRIYRTLRSGLERGRRLGDTVRCMVLTLKRGVADSKRFARWFQILRKRIEHEFHFRLEYASVLVDDGSRVHAHILFKVRSLVSGDFLGLKSGFIPFEWLRNAWYSITKHSYGVFIQKLDNDPARLAHYFVSQYFSAQDGRLRLCYSWNWVFRGFCKVWRNCFALKYYHACIGDADAAKIAKKLIIDSWNDVLGFDWSKLVRLFPFLDSHYFDVSSGSKYFWNGYRSQFPIFPSFVE